MKHLGLSAVGLLVCLVCACGNDTNQNWQGYVEAETLYVSAPVAGILAELSVERGVKIEAGQRLFVLQPEPEIQALASAKAQLKTAAAELADVQKGRRPEEIQIIEAQFAQAQAGAELSTQQLQRTRSLVQRQLASAEALDEIEARAQRDQLRLDEFTAQLKTAKLAGRSDQLLMAEAQVEAARANVDQAQWRLDQKTQTAITSGLVQDILYRPGEFVPAGRPVVALLPEQRIKIRFFVRQAQLAELNENQLVEIICDGCAQSIQATVRYISPRAEYTPPFIYSKENREKFVYLVEAWPKLSDAEKLHPGQPVDVMRRTLPRE